MTLVAQAANDLYGHVVTQPAPAPTVRVNSHGRAIDETGQFLARPSQSKNGSPAAPPDPQAKEEWVYQRFIQRGREKGIFNAN